jgi:hypothetical protein
MCAECGMTPCHPRCPNASKPSFRCDMCGEPIYEGDRYWELEPPLVVCENCLAEMTTEEILEMAGFDAKVAS